MVACAYSPSYSRGWDRRLAWTWEAEVAVSWDHAIALQPGWQSETISKNKTKQKQTTFNSSVIIKSLNHRVGGREKSITCGPTIEGQPFFKYCGIFLFIFCLYMNLKKYFLKLRNYQVFALKTTETGNRKMGGEYSFYKRISSDLYLMLLYCFGKSVTLCKKIETV